MSRRVGRTVEGNQLGFNARCGLRLTGSYGTTRASQAAQPRACAGNSYGARYSNPYNSEVTVHWTGPTFELSRAGLTAHRPGPRSWTGSPSGSKHESTAHGGPKATSWTGSRGRWSYCQRPFEDAIIFVFGLPKTIRVGRVDILGAVPA